MPSEFAIVFMVFFRNSPNQIMTALTYAAFSDPFICGGVLSGKELP